MELHDIDLNLLVIFDRLLAERRVSATASRLGLTQPAVSNALKRLRLALGDELFLRTSRGMEPTPFALQMAEPIACALSTIHASLNERVEFDPARSERKFTIGMTDLGEIELLPRLMDRLKHASPGVTLSTVRDNSENLREEMEAGHVDLAIGLLPQLKTGFFQRRLFMQRYVCMFRQGHALDRDNVTEEQFFASDHIQVISGGTGHARIDGIIGARGARRIRLSVPHFVAVGHILSTTDMIATVPERYARRCLEPFGLKYVQHPVDLPTFGINIFWHAKFQREPGNQWLRDLICEAFAN